MKTLFKISTLLLTTATSSQIFADPIGWIHDVEVSRIVHIVSGGVNVRVTPDLAGCTSPSGYGEKYASIRSDHPGLDRIYSGLLAAQMSGEKVSLYLSDDVCTVAEVVIGGRY